MFRRGVMTVGVVLVMASLATLASAQPGGGGGPGGFGGGMGMGGMFGGGGPATVMSLLAMPTVQTELKLTDDQKTKVQDLSQKLNDKRQELFQGGGGPPDMSDPQAMQKQMAEMQKKLAPITKETDADAVKLLTAEQVTRLKELQIQRDGATAPTNEDVQKKLGLSVDQIAKIKTLQDSITNMPALPVRRSQCGFPG